MRFVRGRARRRRYYRNIPFRRLRDFRLAVIRRDAGLSRQTAALHDLHAELAAAVAVDAIAGRARRGVALAAEAAREVVPHFLSMGGLYVLSARGRCPVAGFRWEAWSGQPFAHGRSVFGAALACFELIQLLSS